MACTLSNKCAKNLSKRTVQLQLIIKNVVTCFFGTQCSKRGELYGAVHCLLSVLFVCGKLQSCGIFCIFLTSVLLIAFKYIYLFQSKISLTAPECNSGCGRPTAWPTCYATLRWAEAQPSASCWAWRLYSPLRAVHVCFGFDRLSRRMRLIERREVMYSRGLTLLLAATASLTLFCQLPAANAADTDHVTTDGPAHPRSVSTYCILHSTEWWTPAAVMIHAFRPFK